MSTEFDEVHFHRLLVAVDGSANADMALSAALMIAQRDHASVTLVSVQTDVTVATTWPGVAIPPPDPGDHGAAQRVLDEALQRIPSDIPVTTVLRHGKPGAEIVALASTGTYDVILLGARGAGHVGALLLGSVSQHVLHHADIAVLVTHAPSSQDAA